MCILRKITAVFSTIAVFAGILSARDVSDAVLFNYGIIAKPCADKTQLKSVTDGEKIFSGDELKVNFDLMSEMHFYMLWEFPDSSFAMVSSAKSNSKASKQNNQKGSSGWLRIDEQTGIERLYLIGSATGLASLERIFKDAGGEMAGKLEVMTELNGILANGQQEYSEKAIIKPRSGKSDPGGVVFRGLEESDTTDSVKKAVLKKRISEADPGGIVFRGNIIDQNDVFYQTSAARVAIIIIELDHQHGQK